PIWQFNPLGNGSDHYFLFSCTYRIIRRGIYILDLRRMYATTVAVCVEIDAGNQREVARGYGGCETFTLIEKNMKREISNSKGVCFGEILWDNLPTGRKLGGAPLNVAYHLNKLGIHTDMLTRVGRDADGEDIMRLCAELAIPLTLFQKDSKYPTSTVEVDIDENKDVRYEIVFPVAWDYIALGEKEIETVNKADFFVFGSLSTRHHASYQTLQMLIKVANYKVFDLNLRAPHYTKERIFELLGYADLVKMNEEELGFVAAWMGLSDADTDTAKAEAVMTTFNISELIITYGAKGAIYHSWLGKFSYHFPALKVEVKD